MKLLLLLPLFCSCASIADLQEVHSSVSKIEASVDKLQVVVQQQALGSTELNEALTTTKQEVAEAKKEIKTVVVNAEGRTEGFVDTLLSVQGGGVAGAISLATTIASYALRERSRRRVLKELERKSALLV